MFHRMSLIATICLALTLALSPGEPGKLRQLDVKGLTIKAAQKSFAGPRAIASADELDKAVPAADAIKKSIDFTKDKLLLFTWSGSGGDKLTAKTDDAGNAVFTFQGGLTRDLRPHVHLFAIPKAAEFKIERGRAK